MRDKKVIEEMVALAGRFGQKIEFDVFEGRGGWCRVKGTDRVIINERLSPKEQIRILAQFLAGFPIEEQSMPPKVRQIIEDARLEMQPESESDLTAQKIEAGLQAGEPPSEADREGDRLTREADQCSGISSTASAEKNSKASAEDASDR